MADGGPDRVGQQRRVRRALRPELGEDRGAPLPGVVVWWGFRLGTYRLCASTMPSISVRISFPSRTLSSRDA